MDVTSLLLILAIGAALLSDKLDRRFGGDGTLRKVLLVTSGGVALIVLTPLLLQTAAL